MEIIGFLALQAYNKDFKYLIANKFSKVNWSDIPST